MDLKLDLSNVSEEKLMKIIELLKEDGGETKAKVQQQFINKPFKKLGRKLTTEDVETYRQLNIIHTMGVDNFWKEVKRIVESKVEVEYDETDDKLDPKWLL